MTAAVLLALCTLTWIAWAGASVAQKRARGDASGTSLFPALPLFPLVAWGAGLLLNRVWPNAGTYAIGALHAALLLVFSGSIARSTLRTR